MIYTIGIAITFFLSLILLTKKEKSTADKILATWLCVIAVHLTLFYLIITQKHIAFPYLLGLEIPVPLLHGPLIFLYTISLTQPKSINRKYLLHFIPYFIGLLALVPFLLLSSAEKINVYLQEGSSYSTLMAVFLGSIIISGIMYSVLSLRALLRYQKLIVEVFSYTEKISLRWLYFLIVGFCIIWVVVIVADDEYIFSTVVLYVLMIGYYGIKQVGIFTNQIVGTKFSKTKGPESKDLPVLPEKVKYEKSELTASQLEVIHDSLVQVMKTEKLYQTPELTLADVAKKLEIHPNILSQVINRIEQKNFFDYINGLRVAEFKTRIALPENLQFTMLSIAFDCGFNSKTSFNRNFKNATGLSPTEYLDKSDIHLK